MHVSKMSITHAAIYDARPKGGFMQKYVFRDGMQPDLGQSPDLKLTEPEVSPDCLIEIKPSSLLLCLDGPIELPM